MSSNIEAEKQRQTKTYLQRQRQRAIFASVVLLQSAVYSCGRLRWLGDAEAMWVQFGEWEKAPWSDTVLLNLQRGGERILEQDSGD